MLTKEYQKGFNHGYILTKYEPKLAELVIKPKNDHSDYLKGLISGKREYKMEKTIGLKQQQNVKQTKSIDKNKN